MPARAGTCVQFVCKISVVFILLNSSHYDAEYAAFTMRVSPGISSVVRRILSVVWLRVTAVGFSNLGSYETTAEFQAQGGGEGGGEEGQMRLM